MKAIFLKELRENIVWALLALLAVASTIAGVAADAHHSAAFLQPVMVNKRMMPATLVSFSVVGFVMGLLAILHDKSVGRQAFLFHRPITRSRIFFAKFCAALLLYLMATALPLAALTIWAAVPGDAAAPFDWHMVLPRLGDLINGIGFLVAGMLVAGRTRARWLGSRLFPLGLPLLALNIATQSFTSIWLAIAVLAGTVVLLIPAAWGAFIRGGEYESQPWIGQLTQAISLGAGVLFVLLPAEALLIRMSESRGEAAVTIPNEEVKHAYVLDDHGKVFSNAFATFHRNTYADLAGNRLDQIDQSDVESLFISGFSDIQRDFWPFSPEMYAQAIGWLPSDLENPTYWFYVPQRRTVEGYDRVTRRFVGSIGPNGFLAATKTPEPFADDLAFYSFGNEGIKLAFGRHSVWLLEIDQQPAGGLLYSGKFDEPIINIGDFSFGANPNRTWRIPMVTASALHVFPPLNWSSREEVASIPIEQRENRTYQLSVAHPDAGKFVVLYLPDGPVVETDGKGKITSRTELPPLPKLKVDYNPESHLDQTMGFLLAPPAGVRAFAAFFEINVRGVDIAEWIVVGLASALAGWLLMRRYAASNGNRWVWTILCGMLGIPGVLLLLSTRQAAPRVACPACGRKRLVANDLCKHCGAPFAPPAREGIEVFATESARRQLEVKVSL